MSDNEKDVFARMMMMTKNSAAEKILAEFDLAERYRSLFDGGLERRRVLEVMDAAGEYDQLFHYRAGREVERLTLMAVEFEKRFRLPEAADLARMVDMAFQSGVLSELAQHQESFCMVQQAMEEMHTPWLDINNTLQSVGGFAELCAIGQALNHVEPFAARFGAALRDDLGDWRSVTELPPAIFNDAIARTDFYRELGFKDALTDFPAATFYESLDVTGIRLRTPPPVLRGYERQSEETAEENESEFELNRVAYNLLLRFETQLRRFINEAMTKTVGPKWIKQRVPSPMRQAWEEKRARAQASGEPDRPLIAYADFTDYMQIIERNDNWRDIFAPIFGRREDVQESFRRLHPIRICTMHSRIITLDDKLLLQVETRRILKAIGALS